MKRLLLSLVVLAVLAPAATATAQDGDGKLYCRTFLMPWKHLQGVKAPGAPVHFWFDERKAADKARAKVYAKETGARIWPALRKLTGRRPLSDAKVGCRHGADGGLDVYIFRGEIEDLRHGAQAVTVPFDVQQSCRPHTPQMVIMRPGLHRSKLAHELFHAFTSAYARKSKDCEVYGPWDEAMATWAMDFVYPDDQVEHEQRFNFTMPQYAVNASGGYGGWAFLRYLTATQGGPKVIRRILEAEEQRAPVRMDIDPVVDAAIPGGFDERIPEYALHAWNAAPVPVAPISASFKQWDRLNAVPMVGKKPFQPTPRIDVALEGATRVDRLQRGKSGVNALGREYFHYRFNDPKVRRVEVRNPMAGTPKHHFNGFALIDGRWRVVDWSGEANTAFCRDEPGQDVQELVLIVSNGDVKALEGARPEVDSSSTCGMAFRVTGYRVTQRTQTDLGWSTQDDQLAGLGPVSSIVSKAPGDDDPEFDEARTVCEFGTICDIRVLASTTRTTDGVIGGPNPADDPCPYAYGTRTFGPFEARSVAELQLDTTAGDPQATLVDSVGSIEVGDATENMCGGNSHGYADVEVRVPLSWQELLSGRPVTVQYDRSGTEPTARGSHSATIGWSQGATFTLQRVNPDGSPYLP